MTQDENTTKTPKGSAKPVSKRSGIMKLLSSTKITPILGLAALISILYYKNKSTKPAKKTKKIVSNVDRRAPLLAPLAQLGRTREDGPMLTRGYFSRGDLVIRKTRGKTPRLEAAIVEKSDKAIKVLPFDGSQAMPLLDWIKAGNGHFALLRVKIASDDVWNKLTQSLKRHAAQKVSEPRAVYASAGIRLPAPLQDATLKEAQWFAALLKQSHYNDFAPTK